MTDHHKVIGACIYCGARESLTDEHVLPLALGGTLVLKDASCRNCATITGRIERRVLRGFMLEARTAGEFPTRRPRDRSQKLPLRIRRRGDKEEVISLDRKQHPGFLHLPLLKPAAVLTGERQGRGTRVEGIETLYFGRNPQVVASELDAAEMTVSVNLDVTSFARLLAKIAYGFAIAKFGLLPRENAVVLPLILEASDDASLWLGSADFRLDVERQNPTHAAAVISDVSLPWSHGERCVVVRLKLFANAGVTGYEIVTHVLPN